jgi:hypothetical protein
MRISDLTHIQGNLYVNVYTGYVVACGGTVQVNSTSSNLRPVITTDPFMYCGWLILGSRDQQIQLSVTSLNLTPCNSLSYNTTHINNCSCSYLEVCSCLVACFLWNFLTYVFCSNLFFCIKLFDTILYDMN